MPDPEIEAMSSVADALSPLDDGTRSRVLRWAAEKYGVTLPQAGPNGVATPQARTAAVNWEPEDDGMDDQVGGAPPKPLANGSSNPTENIQHFADLFDAVQPKTDMEKALTAAFWEQEVRGKKEWQSLALNRELKNLGRQITTINKALDSGMQKKPALVLQLKKTGASRQGRRTYKLSTEGIKYIRSRITRSF